MQKQQQRKPTTQQRAASQANVRCVYAAAVRFKDGSCDIFHVLNADDLDDARAMVLAELSDVRALVLSARH